MGSSVMRCIPPLHEVQLHDSSLRDVKHLATEQGPKSILLAAGDEHLPAGDCLLYTSDAADE